MAGAWSVTVRLNKDRPACRIVPNLPGSGSNLIDFWDETFRRYNSGVVVATVADALSSSSISWAAHSGGTLASGETLAISIQPPNYSGNNDTQYLNSGVPLTTGSPLTINYKNACAINYGMPGPSAQLTDDGTISYTAIDLALASNALTDIVSDVDVTVSGTLNFTPYSPYADTGGTAYTLRLCNGPLSAAYFLNEWHFLKS